MIEVFKTNITEKTSAKTVQNELLVRLPKSHINFDLEDCDRILRIENRTVHTQEVIQILKQHGFECDLLD